MNAILEMVSYFKGPYPDVPVPPEVVAALTEGDEQPMFVTVPVARVDQTSRNGRTYDREAVRAIVAAINERRVTGEAGHLQEDDRATHWGPAPIRWVGATLDADGTAWGKFYVLPTFPQVRDHIRVAMKTKAAIGTSIYGRAHVEDDGRVRDLHIESIDLAHPERVGNPQAAAVPQITAEMTAHHDESEGEPAMSAEQTRIAELEGQISTLERQYARVVEALGFPDDPVQAARSLAAHVAETAEQREAALATLLERAIEQRVPFAHLRPTIADLVQLERPETVAEMHAALEHVLAKPSTTMLLQGTAQGAWGPPPGMPYRAPQDEADATVIHIPAE